MKLKPTMIEISIRVSHGTVTTEQTEIFMASNPHEINEKCFLDAARLALLKAGGAFLDGAEPHTRLKVIS